MNLTFKQYLKEAKYAGQTSDELVKQLVELVYDVFEFVYPDDYDTQEDYTDALIDKLMKDVETSLKNTYLAKQFKHAIWSVYHDLDESEFYDTESYADALLNDIVKEIRYYGKHQNV